MFFLIMIASNIIYSQNDNLLHKLNQLNNKTNPNIKFELNDNVLIIIVFKNNEKVRKDKIYIDDLDVNGIFYDKETKMITIKCISDYCVSRKIYTNGDKKILKNSLFEVKGTDSENKEIVALLREIINLYNANKIVKINNTLEPQVSDLSSNMVDFNFIEIFNKSLSISYYRFFNKNKFSFQLPMTYSFTENYKQIGLSFNYYFYYGEARYYKFGSIDLKQSQVSYFVSPEIYIGSDKNGYFTKYLAEIGVYFQMSNGINVGSSFYFGEFNYLGNVVTTTNNLDYNIKICAGYRFK